MFNFYGKNLFRKFNFGGFNRTNNRSYRDYKVVQQEELKGFLKQEVCVIDVRSESEFKSMRLKNAINIPLNVLNTEIRNVVPDVDTKILVYCVSGERTKFAIQKLNNLGYKNIYIWGNGGLNSLKIKDLIEY